MNVMLASGGYPWTIVPVKPRSIYIVALEKASVNRHIVPFSDFLGQLLDAELKSNTKISLN